MNNVPVEALGLQLLFAESPSISDLPTLRCSPVEPVEPSNLTSALRQTWDWPHAESEIGRARFSILVQDSHSQGVPWQQRWRNFRAEIASLLSSVSGCVAVHAPLCQRLVDPLAFLAGEVADGDHLCGAANVRVFEVTDNGPNVYLLDTLGLHALGLPDLQCVVRGLDPSDVAPLMWDYAYYLYEKGDVIAEGHEVRGLREGENWTCGRQEALAPPYRIVLDLYPGPEHAPSE